MVTIIVFLSVRFIPGDVVDQILAQWGHEAVVSSDVLRQKIEEQLGINVPIHVQYGRWLGDIFLHGSLGNSMWSNRPILEHIFNRLPISIELGIFVILTTLLIGMPIGIYSGIRQDTVGDYIGRNIAIFCICAPSFWLGTMVVVYPSIWWGWSPPVEYISFFENPMGNLGQFVLPGVILGMVLSGTTMRMTRTMMLEVLRQDYIRTAWSKGLRERIVILRHALKNAIIPIVTIVGSMLPILIGGSVIMEQIFSLPGIGSFMLDALSKRDYPVISGVTVFLSSFVLLNNIVIDFTYAYLDPRVQYK